jgi:histidine triad (HIT) family protein
MNEPANPETCLFCRIVSGTIPATIVAQNEHALAFRDLNPTAPTHVLVIPKRHIESAHEIRAEHAPDLASVFRVAQDVSRIEGLDQRGYRLVFNVGDDSGNSVGHLHLHVIGGKRMGWPPFANEL